MRWPLRLFTAPLPGAPSAAALPGLLRVGGRLWPTTWEMLPFSLSSSVTHRCGCPGRALLPSQQLARLDCSCITGQDAGGRQRHGHRAVGWWARGAHEQQTSAAASPGESGLQHVRSCSKNLPVLTDTVVLPRGHDGKKITPWLVWLNGLSVGLRSKGSLVQFPVGAHAWVAGQVPSRGRARSNHTLMFLSLPSPISKNK